MFALQKIARNSPWIASVVTQQVRNEVTIATKPRNRVPFPEKVLHGIFMFAVGLAFPAYISLNLKYYNNRE